MQHLTSVYRLSIKSASIKTFADLDGLEGAQADVGEELCGGGTSQEDERLVRLSVLLASQIGVVPENTIDINLSLPSRRTALLPGSKTSPFPVHMRHIWEAQTCIQFEHVPMDMNP